LMFGDCKCNVLHDIDIHNLFLKGFLKGSHRRRL